MEKRSTNKRRLLILLLLLLVTGVMLTTSTYAWFTSNQNVSVSDIRVNVASSNGIQISADGTNWKSILQTTDLTSVHSTTYTTSVNQIPSVLEPVSTVGTTNALGEMEMWYGTVDTDTGGDYILTTAQSVETESNGATSTGKFVAFDLFLKVTADTPVYLSSSSGITTDDVTDSGIKNASRVAFVTLGNTADGSTISTIQGLNAGATANVLIWEPNYDVHTAAGVSNAFDTYGITTTTTGASLLSYRGVKSAITAANDVKLTETGLVANDAYFGAVTPGITSTAAWTGTPTPTYKSLFTLTAGITKVRVYFWVEGQDVDCENSASGGNIILNLQVTSNNS